MRGISGAYYGRLEKAPNGVARHSKRDDALADVDVGDRVRRDEATAARETARANRECVGDVRAGAVHRALDSADDPSAIVGDDEAGGRGEISCDRGHGLNLFPVCKQNPVRR